MSENNPGYVIRTEGLTKVYDGMKAVDSIDLNIKEGEVFGFLGPNGAGKTTTIGMLVGLIEPTGGKCFIKDIDVTRNPIDAKRIIGYLPDGAGFYPNLTAWQNLRYFAKLHDMKGPDADSRIRELLEYVGLGGVEKPVEGYSRGMKQRLGLAQALLNDPEVIFLDEPTNGLDPQGVIQFRNIIKEQASMGKTVFFSSHILEEVQHVCSTIGIISAGKIVAHGPLDDVRRQMHGDESVTIIIRAIEHIPRLMDSRIIDAAYHDHTAVIKTKCDIRNDIAMELYRNNVHINELRVQEESLEDIFLRSVYGGA